MGVQLWAAGVAFFPVGKVGSYLFHYRLAEIDYPRAQGLLRGYSARADRFTSFFQVCLDF